MIGHKRKINKGPNVFSTNIHNTQGFIDQFKR